MSPVRWVRPVEVAHITDARLAGQAFVVKISVVRRFRCGKHFGAFVLPAG
jgi:hypothetical protein